MLKTEPDITLMCAGTLRGFLVCKGARKQGFVGNNSIFFLVESVCAPDSKLCRHATLDRQVTDYRWLESNFVNSTRYFKGHRSVFHLDFSDSLLFAADETGSWILRFENLNSVHRYKYLLHG